MTQDTLTPAQVHEAMTTRWIGRNYQYLPATTSTNDLLKAQAVSKSGSSIPAGTVILTDYQEKGRGRLSRNWQAPAGSSLLFSILLRPNWPVEQFSWLTMIGGLAVSDVVSRLITLPAQLKWPNDCVIEQNSTWKKYCGTLLEGHFADDGQLAFVVAGIGVNVNIPEEDLPAATFPATSLLAVQGSAISRLDLFCAILARFEHYYDLAEQGQSPLTAWQDRLIFMNRRVVISQFGKEATVEGTAVGTDSEGRLLVRDEEGVLHHIAAGDMAMRQDLEP
ncbi:MAG: biotin--[acetyl-CoA-carboxylase] ligase [Candidatus Promineifilaceae bacterium]|jgi:BirA family biotin operon repressor/biotin-[acetyl-CoA-carboxylase] ligase